MDFLLYYIDTRKSDFLAADRILILDTYSNPLTKLVLLSAA